MNLTKQLEDKKKGCGTMITIGLEYSHCGFRNTFFCDNCKSEIAILEQAIAEMQKQRQEDFKKLVSKLKSCDEFFNVRGYENTIRTDKFMGIVHLFIHQIEQEQLNQPKTEK